jgi:hypothetical protein
MAPGPEGRGGPGSRRRSTSIAAHDNGNEAEPAIHTRVVGKEAVKRRAMLAGTLKIEASMIVPTLIIVASSRPGWRRGPSPGEPRSEWMP